MHNVMMMMINMVTTMIVSMMPIMTRTRTISMMTFMMRRMRMMMEVAWPSGQSAGFEIRRSWVRIPF